MKISSDFLILLLIKGLLCKSSQKHKHVPNSLEGDTLIDKILAADRFSELADKIVEKTMAKINNQQSSVAPNAPAIETKKSNDFNVFRGSEFKYLKNIENKDGKTEKTTKTQKKLKRYKPGKINIEAVLKKKILPSDDLIFRYNRFTKSVSTTSVSDKSLPQKQDINKVEPLNEEPINELTTTQHKVIKKPSADINSKDQNKGDTDEVSKSEEKKYSEKITPTDLSSESTKFADDSETTQVTKSKNTENPFGNEKIIVWNKKDSNSEDSDSESKEDDKDKDTEKTDKTQDTQKTDGKTQTTYKDRYLFRAGIVTESTPNDSSVNEVSEDDDDHGEHDDDHDKHDDDYHVNDQGLNDAKPEEIKNKTTRTFRREGNMTYVLEDSPEYKEYHEELAKIKKLNVREQEIK